MSDNKLYALLAEIKTHGLKVNNLFYLDSTIGAQVLGSPSVISHLPQ